MKKPPSFERETLERLEPMALVEIILRQQENIQRLFEEIERLKAIIKRDSTDSSKPPSTDLLKKSEKKQAEQGEEKRKPGGQPGHEGKTRKGFGRVDRYEVTEVSECPYCGSEKLRSVGVKTRQVARWVDNPIEIVEYQQHQCRCEQCQSISWGSLPSGVIGEQEIEAKLQAMMVWLGHYGHLSYEKQQEWLKEMGVCEIGLGTIAATTARVAQKVKGAVTALSEWIKSQPYIHVDETPWIVKGVKEWLWSFSGPGYALFRGADSRSRAELVAVLGERYEGVLCSDDFSVYNGYDAKHQQKCLAHLRRHFKQLLKMTVKSQREIGEAFLKLIDDAFRQYRHWQETGDEESYFEWVRGFKEKVQQAIEDWMPYAGYSAGLLLRSLREKSQQWWHFLDNPMVPPDNNRAERNLRLGVTKRKVSGGSRSLDTLDNTAALLTVVQTCRAQGRSVVDFFRQALIDPSSLSLIPVNT